MAIFSGKIIEAYFTDPTHKTIEVIYKESDKAVAHFLNVDYEHPDYKDLVNEYSLEEIQKTTTNRKNSYTELAKQAVIGLGLKSNKKDNSTDLEKLKKSVTAELIDKLLDFDGEIKSDANLLFDVKLNLFDNDIVKNSNDENTKTKIRQSKSPWDAINEARKLITK